MTVQGLDSESFGAFVQRFPCAAVLFDAEWSVGRVVVLRRMEAFGGEAGDQVGLGYVDIDAQSALAKAHGALSTPFVEYYRDGKLVAGLGGCQDVASRVRAVMAGRAIGYQDGFTDRRVVSQQKTRHPVVAMLRRFLNG
jgi:thioredoxin-like negative regulator of GroEL